jgi:aspartyl aminopeptidase
MSSAPGRLDTRSCHASRAHGPGDNAGPEFTRLVVLYDHEEVGSRSAQGAGGTLLSDALERAVSGFKGGAPQGLARAVARSSMISVDMAHAVHPNYADRHEPGHRPVIGRGPVLKQNANQSYRDARAGLFPASAGGGRAAALSRAAAWAADRALGRSVRRASASTVDVETRCCRCIPAARWRAIAPMLSVLTPWPAADAPEQASEPRLP